MEMPIAMQRPSFIPFAQHYLAALLETSGTVFLNEPMPRDPNLRVFKQPSRTNVATTMLQSLVGDNDRILISPEIIAEADLVDVLFEPQTSGHLDALGWLGQLVSYPTIIAVLRHFPDEWELRGTLKHWLTWKAEESRSIVPVNHPATATEYEDEFEDEFEDEYEDEYEDDWDDESELASATTEFEDKITKTMLILVPSLTTEMIQGFGLQLAPDYASGVYQFAPIFHVTVVVINQLPVQPATLWFRLLGRGPVQRQAIAELIAMPPDELRDRAVAQLLAWYDLLKTKRAGQEAQRLMQSLAQLR
jgi:hypothetical protein